MTDWTEEQYQAAKDALFINEGACNGSGIALSLQKAYAAWLHAEGTDAANKCAPALVILNQLAHLAGGIFEMADHTLLWYTQALETCRAIRREYEVRHQTEEEGP